MKEICLQNVTYCYPEAEEPALKNFSLSIPSGVTSVIGQNGTGKSTMLLLSGGVVLPSEGDVWIDGKNTKTFASLEERQKQISFIFQNMEFESEESSGDLLRYVYENGFHTEKKECFLQELIHVFELSNVLGHRTQDVSKGELQRIILAFSLLYGSHGVIMDEPVFALEEQQKFHAMEYLFNYAKEQKMLLVFCAHELELCRKFSDFTCIFFQNRLPLLGKTEDVFTQENLEAAYNVPLAMLKQKEELYRGILESSEGQ